MRYILVLIFININLNCYCQVIDTIKYENQISVSGFYSKTNNSITSLSTFNTSNSIYNRKNKLYFSLNYIYGLTNKTVLTNNDLTLNLNVDFRNHKKIYFWNIIQYDNLYSLNIKYRLQCGGGIGYYMIKRKIITLNISDGFLYEYNLRDNFRNSLRLKTKVGNNIIKYNNIISYQPSIIFSDDYVFKITNNLDISLKKWISIKINFINNYISYTNKKNLLYTIGVDFNF